MDADDPARGHMETHERVKHGTPTLNKKRGVSRHDIHTTRTQSEAPSSLMYSEPIMKMCYGTSSMCHGIISVWHAPCHQFTSPTIIYNEWRVRFFVSYADKLNRVLKQTLSPNFSHFLLLSRRRGADMTHISPAHDPERLTP